MKQFLLSVLLFALLASCNKTNITEPEPEPGRRDYVWTRDTLRADKMGFQILSGLWGISPDDVWVIGDAATYVNKVWHYDGVEWKNYLLAQYATPVQIHGVAKDEIWMVTSISDIWRYDGTKWFKHTTIVPEGYKRILFEDIYGYKNNIYAVGIAEKTDGDYIGIIVYYNGSKWSIVNTPKIKEYFLNVSFLSNNEILIGARNMFDINEPGRLYQLKNGTLNLIDKSNQEYRFGVITNELYVSTRNKIYKYRDGNLLETINLQGTNYAGGIVGRSIKDFFCGNYGWNLGHYNGKDIIDIYEAGGNIMDIQIFNEYVFIICYTLDNINYILKGKLK